MASDSYLERLADWTTKEVRRVGSDAELAAQISNAAGDRVTGQTIRNWRIKNIGKQGLRDDSLEKIAKYRQMSVDLVRAWLEGKDGDEPPSSPKWITEAEAKAYLNAAPVDELLRVLESALSRVKHSLEGLAVVTIAELIKQEFDRKGKTPDNAEDFKEFYLCGPYTEPDEIERLRRLVTGLECPTIDDLADLAFAIEVYSGRPCPYARLERLLLSNGHENGAHAHQH